MITAIHAGALVFMGKIRPDRRTINMAMYVLEATNGPLDGKRWQFENSIEIGRDGALVQAVLAVDSAVSRRHARVELAESALLLSDLNSSNGTILRGVPIAEATAIQPGELFVVGRTMLRVLPVTSN